MQQVLYLRKLRDFGEKISDSFLFLKQNWKKLFTIYAVFVVPFLIAAVVMGMFFAGHLYSALLSNAESFRPSDIFTVEFFVILVCLVLAGSSYNAAVYSYFRLYDEQKGIQPSLQQVGQLYFRKLLKVLLYNIIISLLLVIVAVIPMLVVIFIPLINIFGLLFIGILFITIVFNLNCIYVAEEKGLSAGVTRMFELFSGRWWHTIGFTIVVFLIYYVFSFIIQFIFMMVFGVFSINFFTPRTTQAATSGHSMINVIVLLVGLMILIQQVFYIIVFCGVGVNYYSLAEEKDGSAIEEQIDSIGNITDKYGGVEEQY